MDHEILVEAMARAMRLAEPWSSFWSHADAKGLARAALAVARPTIRNEVLEEAARVAEHEAEEWGESERFGCECVARAIRAMKRD